MADAPATEMKLEFHYNGVEVDRGRMDAVALGPAILGIGKALGGASRVIYGDATRLRVEVQADFEHASFGVTVFAVAASGVFGPLSLEQIAAIAQILGVSAKDGIMGVVALVRQQKGRKVESATRDGDSVEIKFTGDNNVVHVTVNEYRVFSDPETRTALRGVVGPLAQDGVDSLSARLENEAPIILTKDDVPLFDAPATSDEVSTDVGRAVLEVVSPVFREGNSWKFAQGPTIYWAKVVDAEFLAEVSKHQTTFGRGDALIVDLETRTWREERKLKYDRRILKVHQHIPGTEGDQLSLD